MFWLCDLNSDGNTFKLRHMKCAENRIFEPLLKECILYGTTREIRAGKNKNLNKSIKLMMNENFTCNDREPGKYFDSKNCHLYHMCVQPSNDSTIEFGFYNQLIFLCPDNLSYDPNTEKCNQISNSRCDNDSELMNNDENDVDSMFSLTSEIHLHRHNSACKDDINCSEFKKKNKNYLNLKKYYYL